MKGQSQTCTVCVHINAHYSLLGKQRYARVCPVRGCSSRPQRKLSQHMKYKHPYLTPEQRQAYLRKARRIDPPQRKKGNVPAGNPTLKQLFASPIERSRKLEHDKQEETAFSDEDTPEFDEDVPEFDEDVSGMEGTRNWQRYDIGHPMFYRFQDYLKGIDGGQRSEKTAKEIATDVSKFLWYACGRDSPNPNWARLTDRDQLIGFTDKLKRAKVGPEGQLSKLDALSAALKFLKVHVLADASHSLYSKASLTEQVLAGWKTTLRKLKRKLRKSRLEKLSSEPMSLGETTALINSKSIWVHFNQTCVEAERGEGVSGTRLDQATIALAASILYKNWQRPGAVVNATLEEFEESKVVMRPGQKTLYIMNVENHKTAMEGVAKVMLQPLDHARVTQYVGCVRPLQDVHKSSSNLFLLTGGRVIQPFH